MTVSDYIAAHHQQMADLQEKLGLRNIEIYEPSSDARPDEPVFVVDLDTSHTEGYADRYFETMFGLQRIFGRPIDMWEKHMFEQDASRADYRAVPLVLKHAA